MDQKQQQYEQYQQQDVGDDLSDMTLVVDYSNEIKRA